jgi:ficolin
VALVIFYIVGDSLGYHNSMKFTTKDQDNDSWGKSCAADHDKGAWWYRDCSHSNLNGLYANSPVSGVKTMNWYHFGNKREALRRASMMIRSW